MIYIKKQHEICFSLRSDQAVSFSLQYIWSVCAVKWKFYFLIIHLQHSTFHFAKQYTGIIAINNFVIILHQINDYTDQTGKFALLLVCNINSMPQEHPAVGHTAV